MDQSILANEFVECLEVWEWVVYPLLAALNSFPRAAVVASLYRRSAVALYAVSIHLYFLHILTKPAERFVLHRLNEITFVIIYVNAAAVAVIGWSNITSTLSKGPASAIHWSRSILTAVRPGFIEQTKRWRATPFVCGHPLWRNRDV